MIMNELNRIPDNSTYALNEYFTKRLSSDKYLLTTRHGGFTFLDAKEFDLLWKGKILENNLLFEKLERSGIIFTKNNLPNIIRALQKQYLFFIAPRSYIINLSNGCNLCCKYCHANADDLSSPPMNSKTLDLTIEFILSAPAKRMALEFQGGEPLANFELIKKFTTKINERISKTDKELSTIIVTNMTLMTRKIAKHIIENKIGLCSSLDGPKDLHNANRIFRTGGGSYETVTKWLSYFRKHGKTINCLPTVTSHSLKFGVKCIIDEYLRQGCRKVMLRPVYHIGRAKNEESLAVSPEDFIKFWKEGLDYMVNISNKGTLVHDPAIQAMLRNIYGYPASYMCMRKPCGAAITQLSISPDGTIFPCDIAKTMPALALGNVRDEHHAIALRAVNMAARSSESQPLCDTCVFGAYCGTCHTRTYAAFSDTVSRTPRDYECKVNKAMFQYLFEKMENKKYKDVFELWIKQR